ncbi:hypothetical protein COHA_009764 [Chlorella ohadii]|uniref:Uncharacterized protein n=1 Tax=Chlorella ohadii TaxID=2649997 RepID=A0AAD5DHP8_9CHLO|nr:hypothetical protein COHA_009764 [Chlorella ohadii]
MKPGPALTTKDWVQVVVVAGIGSVLEWYDFFVYSQLDATLKAAFFHSDTVYWTVFGLAMAARPAGAILFGHIGDTYGRSRSLLFSIILMAFATCAVSVLPTYDIGPYTAGAAAPVLLAIFRVLQASAGGGLAIGGEFSAAVTYVSELASPKRRVFWTAALQVWGWRIPFALSFVTALLGAYMRQGMPEPHAFLEAMRAARCRASKTFSKRQLTLMGEGAEWDAMPQIGSAKHDVGGLAIKSARESEEGVASGKGGTDTPPSPEACEAAAEAAAEARGEISFRRASHDHGRLSKLHGEDPTHAKIPLMRVLQTNWLGLLIQTAGTSWCAAAYYIATSWLPSKLRQGYVSTRVSQGILLVSIPFCILGYLAMGVWLDCGGRSIRANVAVITAGGGMAFGVFYGSFSSEVAAWILSPIFLAVVGAGIVCIGLPMNRLYDPLERITGFSLGYNIAMGVIGGFTPVICNGIRASIPASLDVYAGPFWLLGMAGLSVAGCIGQWAYAPRLDEPFVGKLE